MHAEVTQLSAILQYIGILATLGTIWKPLATKSYSPEY